MRGKTKLGASVSPKVRVRSTVTYVVVGAGISVAIGVLAFFYFNIGNVEDALAETFGSAQTGAWTDGSTWASGSSPRVTDIDGDDITINSGDSVTRSGNLSVKNNTSFNVNSNADLVIDGDLTVKNNLVLNVEGNLVVTGDVITKNGAAITVSGGGNVEINGSATFGENTDFTVDGTLTVDEGVSFGNNSTFDGTGTVNLTGTDCADYWDGDDANCTDNTTLPVELLSFAANNIDGKVKITWSTATELNNDFFTIEKSKNGKNYVEVATVKGKGTTNSASVYETMDDQPMPGNSYYRLVQTDFDGTTEIFRPVMVKSEQTNDSKPIKIYPNPLTGDKLNLELPVASAGELQIFDDKGNNVFSRQLNGWDKNIALNLSSGLKRGVYIVQYTSGNEKRTTRLIKN